MIADVRHTVGSCLEMCPARERNRRESNGLLHRFEGFDVTGGTVCRNQPHSRSLKADPKKCVKEFSRAAAGQTIQKSSDLRPPSVLRKTVDYLFKEILYNKREAESFSSLYDFVFDRLRAVRQDMVVQQVSNQDCVHVLECIVRFHIYSIFRLCEKPIAIFDPHINSSHLQECLKQLLVYYVNGIGSKNQVEIESYYLLHNLGSCDAMRHALTLPKNLMVGVLAISFKLNLAWMHGNFYRVIRLMQNLSFLHCIVVMQHLPSIRRSALLVMSHGFSAKNCSFPLSLLKEMLSFKDDVETKETCRHYGIGIDAQFVVFYKPTFKNDKTIMPIKRYKFVSDKEKNLCLIDILYGINTGF